MEITSHALWTMIHGMFFGALYLLACSGAMVELGHIKAPSVAAEYAHGGERFLRIYLITMAVLAWAAVLTGAYVVYPWYRAAPATGTADLTMFPQRLLMSSRATSDWHLLGMEWKEHIAWFAPIAITMLASVVIRYGRDLGKHRQLRAAVLVFAVASFFAAGIAGFFGAMINKFAPVQGGDRVHLSYGEVK